MNIRWNARSKAATAAVGAIAVAALASGCGAASGTKAGKSAGPLVLRIATRDVDLTGEPPISYFVSRVRQLSGGTVRIDVVGFWGSGAPGAEQQIVRAVATGKADFGAVGTRVFDTLGASSFQALTAPMLIDSYPLERAVIASELPAEMLKGLSKLGVTGLAVVGEWLRKPVSVKRPLLEPADWRGIRFAAFRSREAEASIRALGARPSDVWGSAQSAALGDHRLQGAENDLATYIGSSRQEEAPYVVANVNLWPRTTAVIANTKRLSKLTSEQQRWLHEAATDASARSTSMFNQDGQITATLCQSGAHFANASPAQLAALRHAFAPVYASLKRERETKDFIARIEQLKKSTPRGPALKIPAGCTAPPPKPRVLGAKGNPSAVNGTYRFAISDADLRASGITSPFAISQNHGIYTIVLKNGQWRVHQRADNPLPGSGNGNYGGLYTANGNRITFVFDVPGAPSGAPPPVTIRWKAAGGELRFLQVAGPPKFAWFLHPWKKIG